MGAYRNLLRSLLLIENIGVSFYRIVATKEKHQPLSSIFAALAANEHETGERIEQEIRNVSGDSDVPLKNIGINLLTVACKIVPLGILKIFLKFTLKQKIYTRLSDKYQALNPELWENLVKHEKLQHELLEPYLNINHRRNTL